MNFLGHLYLAGDDPQVRLGNFIADHIKGIPLTSYPPDVARGIVMHRAIDSFTDSHPGLSLCRRMLRPGYQKYASVVLDVLMDLFISNSWAALSPYPYKPFVYQFYLQLVRQWSLLPPYWQDHLPGLVEDDRLGRYQTIEGICESLDIMATTTTLPDASPFVKDLIAEHYHEINRIVLDFLHDITSAMIRQFEIAPCGWELMHSPAH